MASRRSHTKSRKGCLECKKRHVKCDEAKPICSICIRFETSCTWPSRKCSNLPSNGLGEPSAHLCPQGNGNGISKPLELAINDLRLLHHYTARAYAALGAADSQKPVWQNTLVELGFKHPFLLHAILAVSALHLAVIRPEEASELFFQSTTHLDCALDGYQAQLQNLDLSKCEPMFGVATLLVTHAFGSANVQPCQDVIPTLLHCMRLVQGIKVVVGSHWPRVMESEIAPLLRIGNRDDLVGEVPEILRLRHLIHSMTPRHGNSMDVLETCLQAVEELHKVFLDMREPSQEQSLVAMVCVWPASVPMEFLELLDRGLPIALVILAHFAVLLKDRNDCWWLKGWDKRIFLSVDETIGSSPEYVEWLAWPRHQILED